MGDALSLLIGGPALLYAAGFTLLSLGMQVFGSYSRCCRYMKFLTIVLFTYVATVLIVHVPLVRRPPPHLHPFHPLDR